MSQEGINFLLGGLNIDPDSFKIFYNFEELQTGLLPSIEKADSKYYAEVFNNNDFIENGSGNFIRSSGTYLEIQNVDPELNSPEFTFLVSAKINELQNNSSVIFSNFFPEDAIKSGFSFGINDFNKLFFESFDNNGYRIFTSTETLAEKNLFSVSLSENNLSLGVYNFNNKAFDVQTFPINSQFVFPSDQWKIGELNYSDDKINNFNGSIDCFLYFNESISTSYLNDLAFGLFSDFTVIPATIETVTSTIVTGYEEVSTGFFVDNLETIILDSGIESGDPFPVFFKQPLEDNYQAGDKILENLGDMPSWCKQGDLVFKEKIAEASGFGVTGFSIEFSGNAYPNEKEIITYGVTGSGLFVTGTVLIPLTEVITGETIIEPESFEFTPDINIISSYGLDSVSYIGDYDQTYGIDKSEILLFPNETGFLNFNNKGIFDRARGEFVLGESYEPETVRVFLNGIYQIESGFQVSGDIYNPITILDADFTLINEEALSTGFFDDEDLLKYDANRDPTINLLINEQIPTIDEFGNTSGTSISASNRHFFLNGQKLLEGEQYSIVGGNFYLSSFYDLEFGSNYLIYFNFYENETGVINQNYGTSGIKFTKDTSIYFLNGARTNEFIEHSYLDFLFPQQIKSFNLQLSNFNINNDFRFFN